MVLCCSFREAFPQDDICSLVSVSLSYTWVSQWKKIREAGSGWSCLGYMFTNSVGAVHNVCRCEAACIQLCISEMKSSVSVSRFLSWLQIFVSSQFPKLCFPWLIALAMFRHEFSYLQVKEQCRNILVHLFAFTCFYMFVCRWVLFMCEYRYVHAMVHA